MADYCTCGAHLPPDARFCHKCGKPQYEDPPEETEIAPLPVAVAAPPAPAEISFHNGTAVRIAFLAALLAFILFILPLPFQFPRLLVAFVAAGFGAVYLYVRRTGQRLNVRSGARMGWITGIFSFVIVTLFITVGMLAAASQGGIVSLLKTQLPANDARTTEVLKLLEQPSALATMTVFVLLMMFFLLTILPMLGGALGAKLTAKQQ